MAEPEKKSPAPVAKVVEPDEEKFRQQLASFVADASKDELALPASLTPKERAIVHSVAEALGLNHSSEGTGPDRHLKIAKTVRYLSAAIFCSLFASSKVNGQSCLFSPTDTFPLFLLTP